MTNFVETRQSQSLCEEDFLRVNCTCKIDSDCLKNIPQNNWNGNKQ